MLANIKNKVTFDPSRMAFILVSLLALGYILVYSKMYIIPFIVAMIVWFIIHELRENIQQIPWARRNVPIWVQSMIGFIIITIVILILIQLLYVSLYTLTESLDLYEKNFMGAMLQINDMMGLDLMSKIVNYADNLEFTDIVAPLIDWGSLLVGDSFLIVIYVLFLLIEEAIFPEKLKVLYPSAKDQDKTSKLFQKMDKNISRYLTLKTLVSLITGVLSYLVFLWMGLDAPIFWGLLIFVLNYIPTIGSLIATLFPAVFSILQFGEFDTFLYILVLVGFIQVIVGNVIEPKLMGNSLNISSLVVVLSLTIWGAIWGVMGMILSVPITVMMIVVFEEIPSLRPVAVMLSESGKLNYIEEDEGEMALEVNKAI